MIKLVILLLFCAQQSYALEADFFKRQEMLKKEEKKRLKGASSYTQTRKRAIKAKTIQASKYKAVRRSQDRIQKKRDLSFEADFKKPHTVNSSKVRQAKEYAKRKRKKTKSTNWADQNLEFGIEVIKPKPKN